LGDTGDWSEVKTIRPQGVALFVAAVGSWDRNVPDLRRGALGSSRCAEAVRLDRLGHNRERTGREVHPLSDVTDTQRNDRCM
jgi:hypothetical protein